jgi:hypothetical protein
MMATGNLSDSPAVASDAETAEPDLFFAATTSAYVDHPRFVRRDWLATELDTRLSAPNCHFVLLPAAPGAGKSTFLAQLAQDHRDWPVYFIRRDQRTTLGDVSARSFLIHIGYQLAALHPELFAPEHVRLEVEQRVGATSASSEVVGAEIDRVLASPFYRAVLEIRQQVEVNLGSTVGLRVKEWVVDPRLLPLADLQNMALIDPARALLRDDPDRRIVILVDALDELHYSDPGATLLSCLTDLPRLPRNLRFVLTTRPPDSVLRSFCAKQAPYVQELSIASADPRVQNEMRDYIRGLVALPRVASILAETGKRGDFAALAFSKADGNIGYLDMLARAIDRDIALNDDHSLRQLLSLRDLPDELPGLYAFFLYQIRRGANGRSVEARDPRTGKTHLLASWPAVYKRILGVLSVAREPLAIAQIARLGGILADHDYVFEAMDSLRQFLAQTGGRFSLYHSTVAEFLGAAGTRDDAETEDLYAEPLQWHRQIVDHYWKARRGGWRHCDAYGLNNLSAHLYAAGLAKRLYELIDASWLLARHRGGGSTYTGFVADLDLAYQTALDGGRRELLPLVRLKTVWQVVNEAVGTYTDIDLGTLVWLRRESEALAHARLRVDADSRFNGLMAIHQALQERGEPNEALLGEASDIIYLAPGVEQRIRIFTAMAVAVQRFDDARADDAFYEAQRLILGLPGGDRHDEACGILTAALARAGRIDAAERTARQVQNAQWRAAAVGHVAAAFARAGDTRAQLLCDEARRVVDTLTEPVLDRWPRDDALRAMAIAWAEAGLFVPAVDSARSIQHAWVRDIAWRQIAASLARCGKFKAAAATADRIENVADRARALAALGVSLTRAGDQTADAIFLEAEKMARSDESRAYILRPLALALAQAGHRRARAVFDEATGSSQSLPTGRRRSNDRIKTAALLEIATALIRTKHPRAAAVLVAYDLSVCIL